MKRIQYNPLAIRRVAGECKAEAGNVDTSRTAMAEQMNVNAGSMRNEMDKNIIGAQDCMKNTENLLNQAADFMTNLADYLELQDKEIAQKMGE